MPAVAYFEPTPNPNAFKFHTGENLVEQGKSLSFANAVEAERLPLARELFELGFVEAILVADDFVSVSASPTANWPEIKRTVESALGGYDRVAAHELATQMVAEGAVAREKASENPLYAQVDELFDTYVRPALAGDGGGIELIEVEEKVVRVRYQGACGSCPTSTASTMHAIRNLLHDKIDPELILETV